MSGTKAAIKRVLASLQPPAMARGSGMVHVPILCYHSINSVHCGECDPLHPAMFEEHLRFLTGEWNVISLRELIDCLVEGRATPSRAVVITFDDGYRDNHEVALPLLEKYGAHGTVFVVTGFIDGRVDLIGEPGWEAMSWSQVLECDQSEFVEIGAHSDTHAILSTLSDEQAVHEMRKSKDILAERLGRTVNLFAYPYGQGAHISPAALEAAPSLGFHGACSTIWRTTHTVEQRYMLSRVMVNGSDDVKVLRAKVEGRYDFVYPIQRMHAAVLRLAGGRGVW